MQEEIEIEYDSVLKVNSIEDDNLLSGISCHTPIKDELENYNPASFQVSPAFQQHNQHHDHEVNKSDFSMNLHPLQVDTALKTHEQSFSNNQSFKLDGYFNQMYENLQKIKEDLNNQSHCETISDVNTIEHNIEKIFKDFQVGLKHQVNQESKHKRTRSEAPSFIAALNSKQKISKREEQPKIEKAFDTTVFQKQSEEYSLLHEIIKEDIKDLYNYKQREFEKSMELINNYYHLRQLYQLEIQNRDETIQNLQNANDQLNYQQCQKIEREKLNQVLQRLEIFIVEDQDPCPVLLQKVISIQNYKQKLEREIQAIHQTVQQQEIEGAELNQKNFDLEKILQEKELELQQSIYQNEILKEAYENQIINCEKQVEQPSAQDFIKFIYESLLLNLDLSHISIKFLQQILNSSSKKTNLKQIFEEIFENNNQQFSILEIEIKKQGNQSLQLMNDSILSMLSDFNLIKNQVCEQYIDMLQEIEQARQEFLNSL